MPNLINFMSFIIFATLGPRCLPLVAPLSSLCQPLSVSLRRFAALGFGARIELPVDSARTSKCSFSQVSQSLTNKTI